MVHKHGDRKSAYKWGAHPNQLHPLGGSSKQILGEFVNFNSGIPTNSAASHSCNLGGTPRSSVTSTGGEKFRGSRFFFTGDLVFEPMKIAVLNFQLFQADGSLNPI